MTTPRLPDRAGSAMGFNDRSTLLPSMAESIVGSRKNVSPQQSSKDGLELCKKAMALLVGDIRAEVQSAAAALRTEASSTAEGRITQTRQTQLATKITSVADSLQQAEQDALGKLRDLLKHSNWELGSRLDKQMEVNSKMGEHVQNSWEKIFELVSRLDTKMASLECHIVESEEKMDKHIDQVESQLTRVASQITSESKKLQETSMENFYDLKTQLEQKSTDTESALSDQIKRSVTEVTQAVQRVSQLAQDSDSKMLRLLDAQESLRTAAEGMTAGISQTLRQDDRHYTELTLYLENFQSDQTQQFGTLKASTDSFSRHLDPVHDDMMRIRKKVTDDTTMVLEEIGRIQKALHVDYVSLATRPAAEKYQRPCSRQTDHTTDDPPTDDDTDSLLLAKRCRDFFTQTDPTPLKDCAVMTDPVKFEEEGKKKEKKKKKEPTKQEEAKEKMKKHAFGGADKLKEQATAAAMKKQYNVFDLYKEEGWVQRVAKSSKFDNITLFLVLVNSIWIAVDLDLNKADLILDADPVFIIAENLFCLYFFTEVTIRFAAFLNKRNAFKDAWFVFDFSLVTIMVIETWLFPGALLAANTRASIPGGTNMLRMFRLVRLLRLTRLTKLLRAFPELVIIMKGVAFASRSVAIFFALWVIIVYIFAIVFQQLMAGTPAGEKYFNTVPEGINTLLLHGIFGSQADVMNEITALQPFLWPIIVFFMLLVSLTIMYMLLGVLVDVIGMVATSEKQKLEVSYIVGQLREELETMGLRDDLSITQLEFQSLIMEPGIVKVMTEAGVDVVVLADMLELVFEDIGNKGSGKMTFTDLVNIVLSMRGGNPATVKDCKEQIRVTKSIFKAAMEELTEDMNDQFKRLRTEISALDADADDDDD